MLDSANRPGAISALSLRLFRSWRYSLFLVCTHGLSTSVSNRITRENGTANVSTGRIHCISDSPALNQMTISLSRHMRDKGSNTPANSAIVINTGRKYSSEKPRKANTASLASSPRATSPSRRMNSTTSAIAISTVSTAPVVRPISRVSARRYSMKAST